MELLDFIGVQERPLRRAFARLGGNSFEQFIGKSRPRKLHDELVKGRTDGK
jgi:hypothetical protein